MKTLNMTPYDEKFDRYAKLNFDSVSFTVPMEYKDEEEKELMIGFIQRKQSEGWTVLAIKQSQGATEYQFIPKSQTQQ